MGKVIGIATSTEDAQNLSGEMVVYASVKVVENKGIGDDFKVYLEDSHQQQITIMTLENWNLVCQELGTKLHWTMRKANVLIEGVDLENSTGYILKMGTIYVEITGEFVPEDAMDEEFVGLKKALKPNWRGGITGKVLSSGFLNENDKVAIGTRS